MRDGCFCEFAEQRMRHEWARFEFGMELRAEEERMDSARKLHDLHKPADRATGRRT